jgi:hypothetical protein
MAEEPKPMTRPEREAAAMKEWREVMAQLAAFVEGREKDAADARLPNIYAAGTASVEAGGTIVTPSGALWRDNVWSDDLFFLPSQPLVPPQRVKEANDDGELVLAYPWPGDAADEEPYEIRYVGITERSTAQSRKVLEQLGDVSAYYDVQVDELSDRDSYDARPTGYRVLVSDIGDGRAAIYSKASSVDADWTDPAYFSGPVGRQGDIGPIGVNWRGAWSSATTYALNDGTLNNGSSWRSLQNGNTNHSPPVLPTTSNSWWTLIAAKGQDGTGTGDVVGPSSATNGRVAVYDGVTGKLLKDGGKTIAQILAEAIPAGYDELQFTVSQIALAMADALNVAQFLGPSGNRLADSFDALTYVDVAGGTNLDTSTAGVLKPTATAGPNQIPAMTSATTSGVTMSASSTLAVSGFEPWRAGDRDAATSWHCAASAGVPQTLVTGFSSSVVIASYTLRARGDGNENQAPTGWTLQGWNGTSWINLDTRSGVTLASTAVSSFNIASPAAYTQYRLNITAGGNGGNISVAEIALISAAAPNNLTVRSAALTAAAVPTKMKALIDVKEVEAATAGADYTLECSRDNGTTWTAMTLTERYTTPTTGLRVVEAAETDVSTHPSGTAPRWRFKTFNNKNVELHGVYLYWS